MINSNWAKNNYFNNKIIFPKDINELKKIIKKSDNVGICGNLRSYGDTCINKKKLISLEKFSKFIELDFYTKTIHVSSNVLLIDIIKKITPLGYMIDITPGSKYVTIGGMIANNIIGKNSLKNQFKFIIDEIEIINASNKIIKCSKSYNQKAFNLTVGGFGLTGVILTAKIKIKKVKNLFIDQEIRKFNNIDEFFDIVKKKSMFMVSWIDTHSLEANSFRGFVQSGNYNKEKKNTKSTIFNDNKINILSENFLRLYIKFSLVSKLVNYIFYLFRPRFKTLDFNKFFYPQDRWIDWIKSYDNGLFQVQFLINEKSFKKIINKISIFFSENKIKSTFIIIKKINEKGSYLGYQGKGFSLSFDFEINNKYLLISRFFNNLFEETNASVYLSKDSISKYQLIRKNKNFIKFIKDLKKIDKNYKFKNKFSNRLKLK